MNRLIEYLRLGVIVAPLPNTILDGQVIDAVPVMANFQWIVDQVNANAAPSGGGGSSGGVQFVLPGSVGGSANAITLTPTPPINSYAAGQSFRFVATNANTGAVTVNTSGLGPRNLFNSVGAALSGGDIQVGGIFDVSDNGSNYVLVNSSQGTGTQSFTPVLQFGGASVGITYGSRRANYVKILNLVFFSLSIVLTSKGSSSGVASVAGFPYPANAVAGVTSGGSCGYLSNTTFTDSYSAGMNVGTSVLGLVNVISGGAVANLTDANFTNTSTVAFSGFYTV